MKTVILCGGLGSRIRDVSDSVPKPMLTVGRYPILWHIMKYFASYHHQEFVLCLGYKGDIIKQFFLNYESHVADFTIELGKSGKIDYHTDSSEAGWQVTLAETGLSAMTGARVAKIQKYVDGEEFFLTYGDGVGDVDLDALLAFHRSHGRILTVTGVRPPGRFGELVHKNGKIISFNEKPQTGEGTISGGYFVASPRLFEYVTTADDLVFEKEPIQNLVRDQQMMVYEHNGFWQPMDTNREFQLLNSLYEQGSAPWVRW